MKINTAERALRCAQVALSKYRLKVDTLVVSENGDVFANCNVDSTCRDLEKNNVNFFILNGERTKKVPKEDK
jgi:hypothetical protein